MPAFTYSTNRPTPKGHSGPRKRLETPLFVGFAAHPLSAQKSRGPLAEVLLDVVGGRASVIAMAFVVQAGPRLLAGQGGRVEEVIHPTRMRGDQSRECAPLLLVKAVPVGQRPQPRPVYDRVAASTKGDERRRDVCQVPQPRARARTIPVAEYPSIPVTNQIPRSEVVVADQVLTIRGDHHIPLRHRRWLHPPACARSNRPGQPSPRHSRREVPAPLMSTSAHRSSRPV
jgi:hypothetical protein